MTRPADPVFLSPEGCAQACHTVNLTRVLHRLLEAAGIDRFDAQGRRIDIHALRHSAASRFARTGVPLAVAQRILGHSDVQMTARVYTLLLRPCHRQCSTRARHGDHRRTWGPTQDGARTGRARGGDDLSPNC